MKGYITLAQNSKDTNYIRQAYALALSIKNTQSSVNQIAICVENKKDIPLKWASVFDYIIEIPGDDDAKLHQWKIHNKWKFYEMSPFEETVILDADMIFTTDISYWWETFNDDVLWADQVANFKGERIYADTAYRQAFIKNNLPNVYTAFFYFKKSDRARKFFELCQMIYHNWELFASELLKKSRPTHVSGDIVFALAANIDGIRNIKTNNEIPSFVHMKSQLQGIASKYISEHWPSHLPTVFDTLGNLYIGQYKQVLPFHYHIKDWLTDEILTTLEEIYNESKFC